LETIKNIHFIGIGGIGMSGIAEIMKNLGYKITGSDQKNNSNILRLKNLGIKIFIGHNPKNIFNASLVVYSSAISKDNCEIKKAIKLNIPVIGRSEMLKELMRMKSTITVAGSHGKTTTVSLIAQILDKAKLDPTVINGGIINTYGSNTKLGKSNLMLVETDESDGSFSHLPSFGGVITSIDNEHVDFYGSKEKLLESFHSYIKNISPFGFLAVSEKDKNIKQIIKNYKSLNIYKYGFSETCDVKAKIIKEKKDGIIFDVEIKNPNKKRLYIKGIDFPFLGYHNIENALAAISVCLNFKININIIKSSLESFQGVKRRLTKIYDNKNIIFYDDYAHHPTEIIETINALSSNKGRLIVVIQPHRYSRLRDNYNSYIKALKGADISLILPIFEAGEKKIKGISSFNLVKDINKKKCSNTFYISSFEKVKSKLNKILKPNDVVIFMGAGSISSFCNDFAKDLTSIGVNNE
tara:strand:- start:26730 stop:28130 length:1401 start_codon:yes stop_codon:yes gene_type:complete